MKVQIKKIGTSKGIYIPHVFLKFHNLTDGDWVDISDIYKVEYTNNIAKLQQENNLNKQEEQYGV